MKTTLNLDDPLLARAKALAAAEGTTLTALVEDALRARTAPRPARREAFRLVVPTVRGRGVSRVDVASRDALFRLFDEER
ncbi:MAG: type II toxin-antitoxin system VapB family antitoxin [Deltaproteobacteria bacterium]|nr:type II toxin-antitoxin system VapB family antitoxin [Deltaproteobacteria bacterium]